MNIAQRFEAATNLIHGEHFVLEQDGKTGYVILVVVKNGKMFRLGKFDYVLYMRRSNILSEAESAAADIFVRLCVAKMNGGAREVPNLCGNSALWDEVYK